MFLLNIKHRANRLNFLKNILINLKLVSFNNNMVRNKLLLFLFIVFNIIGCDQISDQEYFVNILPPKDNHPATLTLNIDSDTIKIFENTKLNFNFNLYGLKVIEANFEIEGHNFNFNQSTGNFFISPTDFDYGYHTLNLIVTSNSGSGSISDISGNECFYFKKSWVVITDGRDAPEVSVRSGTSNRGFLQFSWNKCEQFNFDYYIINEYASTYSRTKKIYDVDSCFYIDSSYVGDGSVVFNVGVKVKSSFSYPLSAITQIFDSLPKIQFKDFGLDSVKVFWKKSKYNIKYQLKVDYLNPSIVLESTDTSCIIPQPAFGYNSSYLLYIYPNHSSGMNVSDPNKKYVQCFHHIGEKIGGNYWGLGYNYFEKTIYAYEHEKILCYDVDNLSLLNSFDLPNSCCFGPYACSLNSGKIIIANWSDIHIFDDNKFSNHVSINHQIYNDYDHLYLTNNGYLGAATKNKYCLFNLDEKKIVASIDIEDYPIYSPWACISTSNNGKYVCVGTTKGIKIFQIDGGVVTTIFSNSRSCRSVMFNIYNPNQIYLTYNDSKTLEIRSIPDFSLVKSIELPTKQILCNINPDNGLLLLSDYNYLFVYDFEKSKLVYKIKSGDSYTRYYGKRLFSRGGFTIDISTFLEK